MEFERSSGVLLHITSLASRGGIGDLGPAAHEFLRFLAKAKQHVWQVLPLSPTGYGNSPYAGTSAFAGNPFLISLELLAEWGWTDAARVVELPEPSGSVDFAYVEARKLDLLRDAAYNFLTRGAQDLALRAQWEDYESFCQQESDWLGDYALYAVLRDVFGTGDWNQWPEPLRRRDPEAIDEACVRFVRLVAVEQVLQFAFARQWKALREAAHKEKIRILGDVAIFVSMDSADVWRHPELFDLDEELRPVRVAGVPPDYFSPTGQRWGNPLYRWEALKAKDYAWWVERMRRACELYDVVRLDHFRGFEAYWAIPASEETAVQGEWIKGPGIGLFQTMEQKLGPLPLVAEDLGIITSEVDDLREELCAPGMKVLQFGFGDRGARVHLPHRFVPEMVVYTGTHDNDTTLGWWQSSATEAEKSAVAAYAGPVGSNPVWPLIRVALASVAQLAIFPAQDLLELGSDARMNTPSVPDGNWSWRAPAGCWGPELAERLAALTEVTDRDGDPLASLLDESEAREPQS